MSETLAPAAHPQFCDNNGLPLAGGKIYTYAAGTSTPLGTYRDSAGTLNTNPIVLDSGGFADLWLDTAAYKFVVQDATGAPQWTTDNIVSRAASSAITYTAPATAITRTVALKLAETVSVKDYGALGDGVTDDTAAIQFAINSVTAGVVTFPAGTYKTSSVLTLKAGVSLVGYGATVFPSIAGMTVFALSYSLATSGCFTLCGFTVDPQNLTGVVGIALTFCKDIALRDLRFVGVATTILIDRGGFGIQIDNVTSSGNLATGKAGQLKIWSSVDTDYVNYVTVDGYRIYNTATGVVTPAIYLRRAIACHISHVGANDMHVGGDATGILIENDSQGCRITNSIFGSGAAAVSVGTGPGVAIAPSFLTVANVDSDQMTLAGYYISNGNYLSFQGGKITASGATPNGSGVLIQNAAGSYIQLTNLQISGFSGVTGVGVTFSGGSQLDISNNKITGCMIAIGPNGANANVRIHDNDFAACTVGISGSLTGAGNWIYHNWPATSAANVAPAVPASNGVATNSSGFTVRYAIQGGTVQGVSLNAIAMGAGALYGYLNPGETLAITYTVAPTWVWVTEP